MSQKRAKTGNLVAEEEGLEPRHTDYDLGPVPWKNLGLLLLILNLAIADAVFVFACVAICTIFKRAK
jgi:hypothetical protein